MNTSGLSYKPTRVHTHTTQRPNTGALLAELRDRIASQHESSTHSAKRVHSHKTTKTESNAIPHSKSDMYILLRQHKRPHPLCCPKIYQCCGTNWASSKQKRGSSWLSIAAEEKTTTSLHFLQNPCSTLLPPLHLPFAYLASTTWLPLQAISLAPTHPHECSAAPKNHEAPSFRQLFSCSPCRP
jgi:hypothetical protein